MPGWAKGSWGYHGDDGKKFEELGFGRRGVPYGPTYGTGDTIGCGVDFTSRTAFFTKNGEKLGKWSTATSVMFPSADVGSIDTAFTNIKGRLYPVVGISDPETKVTVNFGPDGFMFTDLP